MAKKRILVISPNLKDGVSFWRMAGPMLALQKQYDDIEVILADEINWHIASKVDILMVNRPATKGSKRIIEYARMIGLPIWVDMDDDLFNVPTYNGSYVHYAKKETRELVEFALKEADVVTVSTEALGQVLKKHGAKVVIKVPNALNNYLLKLPWSKSQNKICLWRGSDTHNWDLEFYKEAIFKFAEKNKDWHFYFCSNKQPVHVTQHLAGRSYFVEWNEPLWFMSQFWEIKPKITIVPLFDDKLNRSKSNIAWQEATYWGSACVAPDIHEWQVPGAQNYKVNDVQSFGAAMGEAAAKAGELCETSFKTIEDQFLLSKVNVLRKAIVDRLVTKEIPK